MGLCRLRRRSPLLRWRRGVHKGMFSRIDRCTKHVLLPPFRLLAADVLTNVVISCINQNNGRLQAIVKAQQQLTKVDLPAPRPPIRPIFRPPHCDIDVIPNPPDPAPIVRVRHRISHAAIGQYQRLPSCSPTSCDRTAQSFFQAPLQPRQSCWKDMSKVPT